MITTIFLRLPFRRMHLPVALLSLLLHRAPLLRTVVTAELTWSNPIGALLRGAFAAVAMGGIHSRAGATQLVTNPTSPVSGTVGEPLTIVFAVTGAPAPAASYEIGGALPPGLSIPGLNGDRLNANTGSLSGTPTAAGTYQLNLRAWAGINKSGLGGNPTFPLTIVLNPPPAAPPVITQHPQSQTASVGSTVSFTASATGTPLPTFQWRKDGANIPGATSASLLFSAVQTTDAGSFSVVVSNSAGSVTSNAVALTVSAATAAPIITTQPVAQSVLVGANVTFSVVATGTPAPAYQWRKNGANIPGATDASLGLSNVQVGDSGNYSVVVSNSAGTVTSNAVDMSVSPPSAAPVITAQPVAQNATAGVNVTFSVAATGTPAPTFQWRKDGAIILGATSISLALPNAQLSDAGSFSVVVTNASGSVTSNAATLTVSPAPAAPAIAAQPVSQSVTVGANVTFAVAATGIPAPTFQWRKNTVNIPGGTSASFALTAVQLSDAGSFSVVVSNASGSVTSNAAVLTVSPATAAPVITTQPVAQSVLVGVNVTFSAAATGTPSPTFQWLQNGAIIPGATSASLTLTAVQLSEAGSFSVVASNASGTATSNAAFLTVSSVPTIVTQPVSQSATAGANVTFSVAAAGTPAPTFQWRKDGVVIAGATSNTLTLTGVGSANAGSYTVVIFNSAGSVTSAAAVLAVTGPSTVAPTISVQPTTQVATAGDTVTLSVTASGSPTPTFQWFKDGVLLFGATSNSLALSAVSPGNAGSYTVVVTNGAGSVTSSAANLTVNPSSALSNLSVRSTMLSGQTLIVGAVVKDGTKTVLVRAAGPALAKFGLMGLVDPRLELYTTGASPTAINDDWPGSLTATADSVGAFPFDAGSKDAALSQSPSGSFTVHAKGTGSGTILVEVYDTAGGVSPRLINVSTRSQTGTGADVLIVGFALNGTGTKQVLIRGIGPGLAAFGVAGTVVDPLIAVFNGGGSQIATNDNWDPTLATTFAQVGAFGLPANSKDAALLVTLPAGTLYTVQLSGVNNGTGEALIEVYEVF